MRFAAPLVGLFSFAMAVAALASSRATPESLEALLARSRAASGAPYRYHVVSRSQQASDGHTFDVTTDTEGLTYRTRSCLRAVCAGYYFDGKHSFETNVNDTALPLPSDNDGLQTTLRAIASYAFTAVDFRSGGGRLTARADTVRDGKTYRRISVEAPSGVKLDALLDPSTGLVEAIVSDEGALDFEFADQRKVGGKLVLPFSVFLNGTKVEHFEERALAPSALTAPLGVVPHIATGSTTLPMLQTPRHSHQPIVSCTIGGRAVACLLDTGNSGLAISVELAETLGLEPETGAFDINGIGNYVTGFVEAPQLAVGGATYPPARYVILHDVEQYGYDVVLGADAFAHARITLDYGKRTVTIASSGDDSGARGIALSFENYLPVASLRFGELDVPLGVDSGDEAAIDLQAEFYDAHHSLFKATGSAAVAGIGGGSEQLTGEMTNVVLGDYTISKSAIAATKHLPGSGKGHIGSSLLAHFISTFDYAHARLELAPIPGDRTVRRMAPEPTKPAGSP